MTITADTALDPRINRQLAINVDASENDELTAYLDSLGNWTIGRGHLMPPAAPGRSWQGFTISQSTSDRYFNGDLLNALELAQRLPEWPKCDTQCRQDALTEICFNLGGKWETFVTARKLLEAQNWQALHDDLLTTLWAREIGIGLHPDGKPKRATRIANQFLTGEYPT